MNKKVLWGAVVLALVLSVIAILSTPSGNTVERIITGATPTLDGVDSPWVTINGVKSYYYNEQMTATSSVPCSVKNPWNATSTLVWYSAKVTASGLGSQAFDVSTSTTALASSTPAFLYNVTTASMPSATDFVALYSPGVAESTTVVGQNAVGRSSALIGPGEYVNLRISTSTPGTFAGGYWTGTCKALIQEL